MAYILEDVTPRFNMILTTADKYEDDVNINDSNLADVSKSRRGYKEIQTVVAVGARVTDLKIGDKVLIDFRNYEVRTQKPSAQDINKMDNVSQYSIPRIMLCGKEHLFLGDDSVALIVNKMEFVKDEPNPLIPKTPARNRSKKSK